MLNKRLLLLWFYLATPLFFLADSLLGWNIRISSLDNYPAWKMTYYLFCLCIGLLMWKWRVLEPILGMIEGGVNMLLLTLSVLLPYYAAIDVLSRGQSLQTPLDGAVYCWGISSSIDALRSEFNFMIKKLSFFKIRYFSAVSSIWLRRSSVCLISFFFCCSGGKQSAFFKIL